MRRVIIESPYRGNNYEQTDRNITFARACLRDSLLRGEAPIASHLLYTQPGVLLDTDAKERNHGIEAGLAWGAVADATVVYFNLGISSGMEKGILRARQEGRLVEMRELDGWPTVPVLPDSAWPSAALEAWLSSASEPFTEEELAEWKRRVRDRNKEKG